MGESDDQDLTTREKKYEGEREDHSHKIPKRFQKNHRSRRDYTNLRFYTCDEKGHFSRDCPGNKGSSKENKKKRHDAHTAEGDETASKKTRGANIKLILSKMINQQGRELEKKGMIFLVMKNMF